MQVDGRDLSEGGFYFVAGRRLPVGYPMKAVLHLGEQAQGEITCQAKVVRCERLAEEQYGVGVAIAHLPGADRERLERATQRWA
jgi:hypothetical protein